MKLKLEYGPHNDKLLEVVDMMRIKARKYKNQALLDESKKLKALVDKAHKDDKAVYEQYSKIYARIQSAVLPFIKDLDAKGA